MGLFAILRRAFCPPNAASAPLRPIYDTEARVARAIAEVRAAVARIPGQVIGGADAE